MTRNTLFVMASMDRILNITSYMSREFPNKYIHRYQTTHLLTNNWNTISGDSDTIYLEAIVIPTSQLLTDILNLEIHIGTNPIWNIPFGLILKYSEIKIKNGHYYITLNNKLLGDFTTRFVNMSTEIANNETTELSIFVSKDKFEILMANVISIRINTKSQYLYFIDIIYGTICYNLVKRRQMYEGIDMVMNQYQIFNIDGQETVVYLRLVGVGIYVETYQPLQSYNLFLGSVKYLYQQYDYHIINHNHLVSTRKLWSGRHAATLRLIFKRILPSDIINQIENYCLEDMQYEYLYYFPFGISEDTDLGDSSIHFQSLQNITISISTTNDKYNGMIYVKKKNILRFMSDEAIIGYS